MSSVDTTPFLSTDWRLTFHLDRNSIVRSWGVLGHSVLQYMVTLLTLDVFVCFYLRYFKRDNWEGWIYRFADIHADAISKRQYVSTAHRPHTIWTRKRPMHGAEADC